VYVCKHPVEQFSVQCEGWIETGVSIVGLNLFLHGEASSFSFDQHWQCKDKDDTRFCTYIANYNQW
jgi:hypothetical protein